jgi:hypothetical protein
LISFRYHIVSITAVFLALGLGIAFGSTVRPTTALTKRQLNGLRGDLNNARAEISDLRAQVQTSNAVVKNLASRVTRGALVGRQIVYVDDGSAGSWEGGVRRAMSTATAQDAGTITLTSKWTGPTADADLRSVAVSAGLTVGADGAASAVMTALGEQIGSTDGANLVSSLSKSGYVRVSAKSPEPWPPAGIGVVIFTSGPSTTAQAAALAVFATAAAKSAPVAAIAGTSDDLGALSTLRSSGGLPHLATFDSGASDPTGAGPVLALGAAMDGRGGNFGSAPGLSYLPPV